MEIIILNGKHMVSRKSAHDYLARELQLPSYYGKNLDALADCLPEMGSARCIILINPNPMREALGDYAEKLIEVFADCANAPHSFRFILHED